MKPCGAPTGCFLLVLALAAWPASAEMYCGKANCYELLGVERTSDAASIKKSYRKLSLQWHPDKNPDSKAEATKKFQAIAAAYEVLSEEPVREAYDYYLDHPEEHYYNQMRYYRAVYQPKTPLSAVLLGILLVVSVGQYFHFGERAKAFESSPDFARLLEEEYIRNCTRGRHGYQTGELNKARKAEIREAFLQQLEEDPDAPFTRAKWSNTVIPTIVYHLPVGAVRWIIWRWNHGDEIREEMRQQAEEEAREAEEAQAEEEEAERLAKEKEAQKAEKAKHLARKLAAEEEKKRRWAEEAAREAEAEDDEDDEDDEADLIVDGKVTSCDELRKKGNFLVEVSTADGAVQIVSDKAVAIGQQATVALEGATLPSGQTVRRSKVAGEWSEGQILKLGAAPAAAPEPEDVPEESAAGAEGAEDDGEGDGKVRQRRKKK